MTLETIKQLLIPTTTVTGAVKTITPDHILVATPDGPRRFPPQPGLAPGDKVTIQDDRLLPDSARQPTVYQV